MRYNRDPDLTEKDFLYGAICGTALGIIFTSLPTMECSDSVVINLLNAILLVIGAPVLAGLLATGGMIIYKFLCYKDDEWEERPSKAKIALLAIALIVIVYLRIIGE